jgi:hypothetical protein
MGLLAAGQVVVVRFPFPISAPPNCGRRLCWLRLVEVIGFFAKLRANPMEIPKRSNWLLRISRMVPCNSRATRVPANCSLPISA